MHKTKVSKFKVWTKERVKTKRGRKEEQQKCGMWNQNKKTTKKLEGFIH